MLSATQIRRNIAGVAAAIAALNDHSPVTDDERLQHKQLVADEMARAEARRKASHDLFGGASA